MIKELSIKSVVVFFARQEHGACRGWLPRVTVSDGHKDELSVIVLHIVLFAVVSETL